MIEYSLPIIAALIGWFTNYLAVKMLFHPKKEINLFLFKIQGIFPKRQQDLANKLGEIISSELFSTGDIKETLKDISSSPTIREAIGRNLEKAIYEKLPSVIPMVAMFLTPQLVEKVKMALVSNVDGMLQGLIDEISGKLDNVLDVCEIVKDKVNAFSTDKLEQILKQIMKREFRFIEIIGAILGFMIGLVQLLLMKLM